jgi:hypothetical protein
MYAEVARVSHRVVRIYARIRREEEREELHGYL